MIACSSLEDNDSSAVKFLQEKRVDGVLVFSHTISDDAIIQSAREGFPIVTFDRLIESDFITNISINNRQGGFQAGEHLMKLKHNDITVVNGPKHSLNSQQRYEGFCDAISFYHAEDCIRAVYYSKFTEEAGYDLTKSMVADGTVSSAIFCE